MMDKFVRLWHCAYNPLRLRNLKDFFGIFAGFTGVIVLLVTLGPLKLVPTVEIVELKKVVMVNLDRWLKEYDTRGALGKNELVQVLRAGGLDNFLSSTDNKRARYLGFDPDLPRERDDQSHDNGALSDDFESMGLHYAKEQLGYAERRHWPRKSTALKKSDDLFKWLFLRYGLCNSPHGDTNWTRTYFTVDVAHDSIEKIQDIQTKRLAYENLHNARKTYTVFCVHNPSKLALRNIRLALNLRDNYPGAKLTDTIARDGILIQQDYDEYKELSIPLLTPDEPKFLVIETNNTFFTKDKIAVTYDLMERVNWDAAKILLWIALFLSLGVVLLERLCRARSK